MSTESQHRSVLFGVIAFAAVIIIIGIIGLFTIDNEQDFIQGQVDVTERRECCKRHERYG